MIGKRIGGSVYAHRDYIQQAVKEYKPEWLNRLNYAKSEVRAFPYTIVKVGPTNITFIVCKDFDTVSEPTMGNSIRVTGNKFISQFSLGDPWVYHGKEEMVGPDYKGFDWIKAIMWHRRWKQYLKDNHISHANIGKKSVWDKIKKKII